MDLVVPYIRLHCVLASLVYCMAIALTYCKMRTARFLKRILSQLEWTIPVLVPSMLG